MMRRLLIFAIFATVIAVSAYPQDQKDRIWVWFPDGTCLALSAESTGVTPLTSTNGGGMLREREIYRFVYDSQKVFLFAYQLEAKRSAVEGAVFIRIKPLDPVIEKELSRTATVLGGHIPTVATVREFPVVRMGEALKLDILYNPTTKETIYDVLRPLSRQHPSPEAGLVISGKEPD
jgi:hypothetical protein